MKKLFILFIYGLFGFAVNAQTKKHILKGQVTDISGQPIKKALVSDIITADSARTVEVGMFSLYSSNEIRSVEVSKIGYEDTRMSANGSKFITVMMRVKQEVVESELPAEGGCVIPIQEEVDMMDATNVNMTRHKEMPMGATMMWKTPIESNTESYSERAENDFHIAQNEPLRAFSIDVDRASYSSVRRFINNGQLPPVNAVRIEEMINYFDYEYHAPKGKDPVRIFTEVTQAPWNSEHHILHIGLKAKDL